MEMCGNVDIVTQSRKKEKWGRQWKDKDDKEMHAGTAESCGVGSGDGRFQENIKFKALIEHCGCSNQN